MEDLQKLLTNIIKGLDKEHLDNRINTFVDYKTKYVVLKPCVKVKVELTEGKIFEIDITDYFEGVVR